MQKINNRRGGSDNSNNSNSSNSNSSSNSLSASSPAANNNNSHRLRCSDRHTLQKLLKEELRLTIMAKRQARGEGEVRMDSSEPQSHQLSEAELERKERRREQNRRAAQRCRRKKRLSQMSVLQNYEWIISHNQQLRQEVDQLRQETSQLQSVLRAHREACTCAGASTLARNNNNIKADLSQQQLQLALPVAPKIKVEPCEDSPSSAAHGVVGYGGGDGGGGCNAGDVGEAESHSPVLRLPASSSCLYGSEKVVLGSEQNVNSCSASSVLQQQQESNTYTSLQRSGCPYPGMTVQAGFHSSSSSPSSSSPGGGYPHHHHHNHNNNIASTLNNNNNCIKNILNNNNNPVQSQQHLGRLGGEMTPVVLQGESAAAPSHLHHRHHNHHHQQQQHHHQPSHNNSNSCLTNNGIAMSNGNSSSSRFDSGGFAPATSTPFASPPPQVGIVAPTSAPVSMPVIHSNNNNIPQSSASARDGRTSAGANSNSHLTLLEEFSYLPGGGLRSCVFQEEAATPLSADGRRSISSVSSDLSTTTPEHQLQHQHHHHQQQQQSHQHNADVAVREEQQHDVIMSDYSTTHVNVTTHDDVSQLLSQINQNDLIFQQDGAAGMDDVFASDAVAVSMASTLSEHFLQNI